jgi:hypothetical protein
MSDELQEKLKAMGRSNPIDEVVKTMLKSGANTCVRAQVKLAEIEKQENDKKNK